MNTYPSNPSSSSNYSQSQSINPALLAGGFSNPQQQQQQRYGGGGGGFGGAGGMGGGVNPAQLMNGSGGGMNGQGQGSISANQLLHQQQQRQQHQQHMMNGMNQMGGGGGMGNMVMGGMGGINPAALASSSSGNSSSSNMMNMNNVNINPMMLQNQTGSGGPSQINTAAMLNMLGITREQFAALSPQEKNAAGNKAMVIINQQNQQMSMSMGGQGMGNMMGGGAGNMMGGGGGGNMLGGGGGVGNMNNANMGGMQFAQQQNSNQQIAMGGFFDRPSSSASSHSTSNPSSNPQNQNQMMPPPPPRPTTAAGMHGMGGVMNMGGQQSGQGQGHPSRPGTSMAHRSPTIPGPGLGGGMGGMGGSIQEQRMMQERMHRQQIQQMHNQQQMEQQQQQHQQQQDPRFHQQQMEHQQRMREQGMHEQQRAQEQQRIQEQQQRMQLQMGIQRPSSRMSVGPPGQIPGPGGNMGFNANAGGMMNGFPQKTQQQGGTGGGNIFPIQSPLSSQPHIPLSQTQTPQQQRGGQPFGSQQQHEGSPPPMSPYRGAKRKVGGPDGVMGGMGSPRMGGGMGLPPTTPMGPPGMPRTVSGDGLGGIPSPSTPTSGGLGSMNMNVGMPGGAGNIFQAQTQAMLQHQHQQQRRTQSPRPQSSMGMVPGGGGMDIPVQRQRQGSIPPQQFPSGNQQTPQRQGSLPPSGMMGPPPQMSKPLDPAGLMGIGVKSGMSGMGGMPGMVMPPPSAAPAIPGMHPPTAAPGVIGGGIPLAGPGAVPGGAGMGVTPQQQQALASSLSAAGIPAAQGGLPASGASVSGAGGSAAAANLLAQLPPLPPGVSLNPAITRVSAVPLIESVKRIPPLSEDDVKNVQGWIKVDKEYEVAFRRMKERMAVEARETFGPAGASWWEKGFPGGNLNRWRRGREQFDVRYPRRREKEGRDGRERKRGVRREGLRLPRTLAPAEANRPEQLIPIRLEFDVEHHKMRDTFVWNLNDPVVTPEHFAQSLVEDYALPSSYHSFIVKSIQDQLSDYKAHSANYDGEGGELSEPEDASIHRGVLDEESLSWWESWRKRVRAEGASRKGSKHGRKRRKVVKVEEPEDMCMDEGDGDDERPMTLEELELDEQSLHEDMRILIKLDIIVGAMKLDDQFEWDLDNTNASPEDFADVYTQELGLCGEFKTAIAHSIREQVQTYQKSLFLVGHQPSDGALVQDEDLKQSFLPSLMSGARPVSEVQMFTPLLNYLSDGEIDRTEKDRDKDLNKRRKRNTRGRRGIALPDREPIRTYRTPAIGFPELDPATLALAAAANAPMSRRAAAAAASLTIANMVASENGTPFMPQSLPSQQAPQPPPTAQKEKKPKGLFKAPPIPPNTLRPRALVAAPTPSTAADVSKLPAPLDNDPPPSSNNVPALDSKAAKILSAKRAKELEREAKEKEFVDGQHPNYIDGVWHCSNCGCPESIAIGRRKGPLGDKSQCGTCGKFWHRHRRPRPVEYNADADYHSGLKQREAEAKMPASKRKGAAAALRAQSTAATPMADISEPQTPARSNGDVDASSRQSPTPAATLNDDDRAISPVSTASSASEPPLAQRVKLNGSHSKPPATPHPPPAAAVTSSTPPPISKPPPATELPAPPSPSKAWPPAWLTSAMQLMQDKYHNDRFEVILRKVNATSSPEWRIKCLDCPGKLYTPGPGETLSNYEVHLKNRLHRQKVNERVTAAGSNGS